MALQTMDERTRLAWVKAVVALGFLGAVVLTPRLWLSTRTYPLVPVFETVTAPPFPGDFVGLGLLLVLLTLAALPRARVSLVILLGLLLLLTLQDQSRWTPWSYQYSLLLIALAFHAWRRDDASTTAAVLATCQVVMASLYFWGGMHKANVVFVRQVWPWFLQPLTSWLPAGIVSVLSGMGVVVPVVEASTGLALLTRRFRHAAVAVAVAMHAMILLSIGPFGHHWDASVWPWNVTMMLLVAALFWEVSGSVREIVWQPRFPFHTVVLVLCGVMPLLGAFGLWDSYLSAMIYSGNTRQAAVLFTGSVRDKLPVEIRSHVRERQRGTWQLDVASWALREIGVEPYPEPRIYRQLGRELCRYAERPTDVILLVSEPPTWSSRSTLTSRYDCAALSR